MKIKYNWEFERYVTEDGKVLRYDYKQDKLVLCKLTNSGKGYIQIRVTRPKNKAIFVHRLVYETFVDKIQKGFEIDHINTIRNDNRLENLRCVTRKENNNNPVSLKHRSIASKNLSKEAREKISLSLSGRVYSEFGRKFKEHFGITNYENPKLYHREYLWYLKHNHKCRWE